VIYLKQLLDLFSTKALAVVNITGFTGASDIKLGFNNITTVITNGISIIVAGAGVIFMVMLIIGGVQYVTSGGDKVATTAAKDRITYALIGILIVAATFAIVKVVETVTGIGITNANLPAAS
jgi:Type IV secretion system pilin